MRRLAVGVLLVTAVVGCTSDGDTAPTPSPVVAEPVASEPEVTTPSEPDDAPASTPVTSPGDVAPQELGPLGERDVEIATDDGLIDLGDAAIPDVVASDFPVPDDLDVQLSSATDGAAGFGGETQQSFEGVLAFYEAELPAAGYETTRTRFVDGVVAVLSFDGPNGRGEVAISSAPGGGRSVLVTFQT